ncbi:MAG: histidine kinase [FCB group bacterium]|nr:histidine kinase [FCB group bacterium]
MRNRINDVLLVSSLYDSFILGEDGHLYEMLLNEYIGLNLSHTPGLTRVSSGQKALEMIARGDIHFDLIITTLHLEDLHVLDFAQKLRNEGLNIPLVLLTYDARELNDLVAGHDVSCFDKVFMWQGSFNILLAIIKCIEDILNVKRDTELVGVQSIILIEDNVKFYSSYMPIIYTELIRHSHDVIAEGVNLAHKMLRLRARPKILLCETYEAAWEYYENYHESILGIISDVRFPREGRPDPKAGIAFARAVKEMHPDIPILLQSKETGIEKQAHRIGASFLLKNSPRLLHQLRKFMKKYFSFGDFVFCLPDGSEVDRARDLRELEEKIHTIPEESILFHAERNHFSNWLKARTEFFLAHKLRPQKVTDYESVEELRQSLISSLREYHIAQHRGIIVDFDPDDFDPTDSFARIGGGSLGGKGRGLAFASTLFTTHHIRDKFKDIDIAVPPTVILGTDVFDDFLDLNDLGDFALSSDDDEEITRRFVAADLPGYAEVWLRDLLRITTYPLAIRSSSLLEDSQYQPFAGVYATYMLPNNHRDLGARLIELMSAVKRVYASTFSNRAKAYIRATPYRLEEEKMAVIIQRLVGQTHHQRFYPDFSGVARSHNFYPIPPMKSDDGIVSVALGLGIIVVEGGATIRFCPKFPRHIVQFSSTKDSVSYSQKEFYALEIPEPEADYDHSRESTLLKLGLDAAESDDVLGPLASTYSHENNAIFDGLSRDGVRIITFASILKNDVFPLSEILTTIMNLGSRGISSPVELEFSVNLSVNRGQPREFRLLQMRPMVLRHEISQLELDDVDEGRHFCRSTSVLGNGVVDDIHDIIAIDRSLFERSKSREVAREIGLFNLEMIELKRPYLLVGIGRWGSADPWLGIPVGWEQISGAGVIIETGFDDMKVTPSQGTHFFQNLTAFQIGYFTINADAADDFLDWDWLADREAVKRRAYTSNFHFDSPIVIKMDGRANRGIIVKPENT